ncbi:MAG: cysteine--tRNA ligase [Planctomycetes bacterium]|nr:cysteine--tRNA ligase [Planctomycetota bacterium]
MPVVQIHNTLTGKLEELKPIAGSRGPVTFYSCGPTVYDDAHIGNFRSFLNADILRRTIELTGTPVKHVMNITDVGHMTDDTLADGGGEDKMAVAGRRLAEAKKSGKIPAGVVIDPNDPLAIADFYAGRFLEDARLLGLKVAIEAERDPTLMPRPTKWIGQMLDMIKKLVDGGHAYVAADGAVYFDVKSFPDYGRLSGNTLDNLREGEGGRISAEHQALKKNPGDFMLWKPDPKHVLKWDSPYGAGYPGWHIECSAMAAGLLGAEIDLHSGGEDNIFPHHECEIAQSRCAHGKPAFARMWFHTRHLIVEGEKMSKSKGNFFTARDLFQKGVTPAALRLEITRTHYRTNANFTMQGLADCQRMIDRWSRAAEALKAKMAQTNSASPNPKAAAGPFELAMPRFTQALCEDLNMARAIAALNEAVAAEDAAACPHRECAALQKMDSVLGVLERNKPVASGGDADFEAKVNALIEARAAARRNKDFAASDKARNELEALGVQIKDGAGGTTWSRVVR